jgi:hypothetical protein
LLDIYWNILTMHGPINVKSPNNISKWQMGFNSAFKGLINLDSRWRCVVSISPRPLYLQGKPLLPVALRVRVLQS